MCSSPPWTPQSQTITLANCSLIPHLAALPYNNLLPHQQQASGTSTRRIRHRQLRNDHYKLFSKKDDHIQVTIKGCVFFIQGVRKWSPKNFRVSLWGKMWSKTLIQFFPNINGFLKNKNFKWCPTVWELLHHFIVVTI
jgi:hypothetical protein